MSKLVITAILVLLCTTITVTSDAAPRRIINFNDPEALDALACLNPGHYDKVRKILESASGQSGFGGPGRLQVNFKVRDVKYTTITLMSDPPKKRLSFVLDDTRYEGIVTLRSWRGTIVPLKLPK